MIQMCKLRERVPFSDHVTGVALLRLERLRAAAERGRQEVGDLETCIEDRFGPTTPVLQDLGDLVEALEVSQPKERLQECFLLEDGRLWMTMVTTAWPSQVRVGDSFVGGLVLTGDLAEGTGEARCRPVRLLCQNGQVMPMSARLGTPVFEHKADGTREGSIAEVVSAAFSRRIVETTTNLLQRTAMLPAEDPGQAFAMLGLAQLARDLPESVRQRAMDEEPTAYGVLNAVTRAARETEDLALRYRLEHVAGRMIERAAGLPTFSHRGTPQRV